MRGWSSDEDREPQVGDLGEWGILGEFTADEPADSGNADFMEHGAGNPGAFVRMYIGPRPGAESGWVTVYTPPEDDEQLAALIDYYHDQYERMGG